VGSGKKGGKTQHILVFSVLSTTLTSAPPCNEIHSHVSPSAKRRKGRKGREGRGEKGQVWMFFCTLLFSNLTH